MDDIDRTEESRESKQVSASATGLAGTMPQIRNIPIENIKVNPLWVRRNAREDLDSLTESIGTDGILQFPGVRDSGDGTFTIVFGHRRYLACKQSGNRTIPCRVLDVTEEQAALLLLVENLHQKQLYPVDEARTIRRIADRFHWKDAELAQRLNWKPNVLSERLAILALPDEMLDQINEEDQSRFKFTHAVTLSRLWDPERSERQEMVRALYYKTIRHALSTTELKESVALVKEGDLDRLPDRFRTALLNNKGMTAALARLYLRPQDAVVGKDRRATAMRAAARKLHPDELEKLVVTAMRAGWTYEKTRDKLLKGLEQSLTAADPEEAQQRSGVDRVLACVSALDQQLAASRDGMERLARSHPQELGAVWFAIVQLQKRLQSLATLIGEATNGSNPDGTVQDKETAHVGAG